MYFTELINNKSIIVFLIVKKIHVIAKSQTILYK